MDLNNGCSRAHHLLSTIILSILLVACGSSGGGGGGGALSLSVAGSSVLEGNLGDTADLTFLIALSESAPTGGVSIDYETADVSATAGSDYEAANGTLTILAGGLSDTVSVSVTGDIDIEDLKETFTLALTLRDSSGAEIGATTATGTIYDDDSTSVSIGVASGNPQSACDNPWLPLREDAVWMYDGSENDTLMTITSVTGDLQNATAQMQWHVPGAGVLDYEWVCTSNGGMSSQGFVTALLPAVSALVTITSETVTTNGQYLLPADQLMLGAMWDYTVTAVLKGTAPGGASGTLTRTLEKTIEIIGVDPVTTGDGVIRDALQISRNSVITQELVVDGIGVVPIPTVTLNQMQTMARGVGITYMETDDSVGGMETHSLRISSFP